MRKSDRLETIADLKGELVAPMTDKVSEAMVRLYFKEMQKPTIGVAEKLFEKFGLAAPEIPPQLGAIVNRLQVFTPEIEYSAEAILFASCLCSTFGICTIWAHTFAIESQKRNRTMTLGALAKEIIPWGVPTEAGYHKLWIAQKGHDDKREYNRLDRQEEFIYIP